MDTMSQPSEMKGQPQACVSSIISYKRITKVEKFFKSGKPKFRLKERDRRLTNFFFHTSLSPGTSGCGKTVEQSRKGCTATDRCKHDRHCSLERLI